MSAPKGHSAVRAMKKPGKLSSGEVWEKLELYPTPPWATRALFEHVLPRVVPDLPDFTWDPCAGLGHMLAALEEYSISYGSDVHLYDLAGGGSTGGLGVFRRDFFDAATLWPFKRKGWIVTNPPFVPAADILDKALAMEGVEGVALLLRLQWLTTEERYSRIFSQSPPILVAPFVERVSMCLGGYVPKLSTATDYAWFVWARDANGWRKPSHIQPGGFYGVWIPPCRDALWRETDRALAARCVPGFVPPSTLKKVSPEQAGLALA